MRRKSGTAIGFAAGITGALVVGSAAGGGGEQWVFPGEFESHQALWMMWPTFSYKADEPSEDPISAMIDALRGHTQVNLIVNEPGSELGGDAAAARQALAERGVSDLSHVHFFEIPHTDIWARDVGPEFMRSATGRLRINDWNFNAWGYEDPGGEIGALEEKVDAGVAEALGVPLQVSAEEPQTGVRMIHEGGAPTQNGRGTMIIAESVVIQRSLGPGRFCGGDVPRTDYGQPNTYAVNETQWAACKQRVEAEYRRMLGVRKYIWTPTGVVEDDATFRGPLFPDISVSELDGVELEHPGAYTLFTVNGHMDEAVRFTAPDTVVLAEEEDPGPLPPDVSELEALRHRFRRANRERLERIAALLASATNEAGEPLRIFRIPTPRPSFEVFRPGDSQFDYFEAYPVATGDEPGWEHPASSLAGKQAMLAVLASSYANYVETNGLILVSAFAGTGGADPVADADVAQRNERARAVLAQLYPGREVVQIDSTHINRGGGGMHCITQHQPASAVFARLCGWAKVRLGARAGAGREDRAELFALPVGLLSLGRVPRVTLAGEPLYLRRLGTVLGRVLVLAHDGRLGWVEENQIESAGEQCPTVYTRR